MDDPENLTDPVDEAPEQPEQQESEEEATPHVNPHVYGPGSDVA